MYKDLLQLFVDDELPATEFEKLYLVMFKGDDTCFSDDEFKVLNDLFTSCDRYCDNPELFEPGDLSAAELRREAEAALEVLTALEK